MNGFESFQIGDWLENGLTHHVKRNATKNARNSFIDAQWRKRIILPVVAAAGIAVSVFAAEPAAAQSEVCWPEYFVANKPAQLNNPDVILGSPASFWARQIEKVRLLKRNETQAVQDPPSIF